MQTRLVIRCEVGKVTIILTGIGCKCQDLSRFIEGAADLYIQNNNNSA